MDQGVMIRRDPQVRRPPTGTGLYDVLDLILDKGLVIDAFVRVSLVGIELVTVDARVVIASVDTYLRYAREAERLQLYKRSEAKKLPDAMGKGMTGAAVSSGAKQLGQAIRGDDDDEEGNEGEHEEGEKSGVGEKLAHGVRHVLTKGVGKIMGRLSGDEGHEDDDEEDNKGGQERQQQRQARPEQRRQAGGNGNSGKGQPAKAGAKR
jgi:gas vesicle structural protein